MNNPIRHIASEHEDGVQFCIRCLKILIDSRRDRLLEAEDLPLRVFEVGATVFEHVPTCDPREDERRKRNAVNCVPMGEGL